MPCPQRHDGDDELCVVRAVHALERRLVCRQPHPAGVPEAGHSAAGCAGIRCDTIPLAFGQPEVIHHAHAPEMAGDAAVIKSAPERLAASPRELFRLQITPARFVLARPVSHRRAIFGHHVRNAGIDEQPRAIAVVAGNIAKFVNVTALAAANGRRSRGSSSCESSTTCLRSSRTLGNVDLG